MSVAGNAWILTFVGTMHMHANEGTKHPGKLKGIVASKELARNIRQKYRRRYVIIKNITDKVIFRNVCS